LEKKGKGELNRKPSSYYSSEARKKKGGERNQKRKGKGGEGGERGDASFSSAARKEGENLREGRGKEKVQVVRALRPFLFDSNSKQEKKGKKKGQESEGKRGKQKKNFQGRKDRRKREKESAFLSLRRKEKQGDGKK